MKPGALGLLVICAACAPRVYVRPSLTVTDENGRTMRCVRVIHAPSTGAAMALGASGQSVPTWEETQCAYDPAPRIPSLAPPPPPGEQAADYDDPR